MSNHTKIEGTLEAWDTGILGNEEEFVKKATDVNDNEIDEALELQMISIRLQKSLIEDFKMIAKINGIGYQPLIRQILKRFADCEKKKILREHYSKMQKEKQEEVEDDHNNGNSKVA